MTDVDDDKSTWAVYRGALLRFERTPYTVCVRPSRKSVRDDDVQPSSAAVHPRDLVEQNVRNKSHVYAPRFFRIAFEKRNDIFDP